MKEIKYKEKNFKIIQESQKKEEQPQLRTLTGECGKIQSQIISSNQGDLGMGCSQGKSGMPSSQSESGGC